MVQVVTQETRREARQAQRQLEQQRTRIEEQQRRLSSAGALRSLSRAGQVRRQQQLRSLGQASQSIQENLREVNRLASLPTVSESGASGISEGDIKLARRLASQSRTGKSIPISAIGDKNLRRLVVQIIEGKTPDQIIAEAEQISQQSLSPEIRQQILETARLTEAGATLAEIRAQQSLRPEIIAGARLEELRLNQSLAPQNASRTVLRNEAISKQPFELLIKDEKGRVVDINIGGAVRTGAERFVARIGQKVDPLVRRLPPSLGRNILLSPSPIGSGDLAIDLLFAPSFSTATGSRTESEFVQDQITGRFIKKSEANKLVRERLDTLLRSGANKIKTPTGEVDLLEITRRLIQQNKNKQLNLRKLAQFYESAGRSTLFKDIIQQEGLELVQRTGRPISFKVVGPKVGKLKGASIITGATGRAFARQRETERISRLPSMVGGGGRGRSSFTALGADREVSQFTGSPLTNKSNQLRRQGLIPISISQQRQIFRQQQLNLQNNLQRQGLTNQEIQQELQRLKQDQRQRVRQAALTLIAQRSAQRQQQQLRQRSRFDKPTRFGRPSPKPRIRIRTRLGLPLPEILKKRVKTMVTGKTPRKFDVFAKVKGRLTRISTKPIIGKAAARDFLAKKLDTTLRASGTVQPSDRSGSMKVAKSTQGFLSKNRKKFFTSKKTGLLTEKPKFRLEKRGPEVKDIKRFRRRR